jgi:group II intron reverse transcriptase/maturase
MASSAWCQSSGVCCAQAGIVRRRFCGDNPQGRWPAAAARHPNRPRPSGPDGRHARAGADLRGGFSRLVVWVSAEAERHAGPGSPARARCARRHPCARCDIRDYFGSIDQTKLLVLIEQRISDRRVLKLLRQWLAAGVMEAGHWSATGSGTPQGGVISPLLSNIYLHVLDRVWEARCAHVGTLVRYADDFVVMCDTKAQVEEARQRVSTVLARLGLELHPEKTRTVDLSRGREGFDFLGCHLRKRMSGPVWERTRRRVFYLQRWPSHRAMSRVRARVRGLTPRSRCHEDLRRVIADVNAVVRGWGQYFRTGNATTQFIHIDQYVEGSAPRLASAPRRQSSSRRSADGLAPSLLRSLGALPPARNHSVSGGCVMLRLERPPGKPCAGDPHARFERGSYPHADGAGPSANK